MMHSPWSSTRLSLPKDTHNCAVCGDHPTILEPIDYEQEVCEETAADLMHLVHRNKKTVRKGTI